MKNPKRILSFIFWAMYVYFALAMIYATWQMLNPKDAVGFVISIVLAAWYYPGLAVFGLATWLFYRSLSKNYIQSKNWAIIRILPLAPIAIIVLIWLWCLFV